MVIAEAEAIIMRVWNWFQFQISKAQSVNYS